MEYGESENTRGERTGTLVLSALFVAFGLFWSYAALGVPARTAFSSISPGFLPFWAGLFFAFMGVVLFVQAWRRPARQRPVEAGEADTALELKGVVRVALMMAALLGFILALEHVHYAISTFFVTAAGLAISGEPIRPRLFLIAAAISGLFFLIFIFWLGVPLPGSRYF